MVSLLSSRYRMSKRQIKDWFMDVYRMPMSIGSVSNMEHTVSKSLEDIYGSLHAGVKEEPVIHMDETGFRQSNRNGWAWLMSTPTQTCFKLAISRGRKVAREMVGDHNGHTYVTDRYSAYNWLPDKNRQVCWAHLKRDFKKISERPGIAGLIGKKLLKVYRKVFGFLKTEYDPDLPPHYKKQKKRVSYFRRKMMKLLQDAARCSHAPTARTCKNILECADSLWNFFEIKGVPPTNNHAERQLRPLVISKKLSFGTQSERGSRFIERIFSVVTTCRQQNIDILSLLAEAIRRNFIGSRMGCLEDILVTS